MDDAFAAIDEHGERAHGTLITADEQTAGRGRRGRRWAGVQQLALSAVVDSRRPPQERPLLALAAGLAVSDLCEQHSIQARIKWPNDVLIDGRKLSGVLVEGRGRGPLVLGIGLNMTLTSEVRAEGGCAFSEFAAIDRTEALEALVRTLEARIDQFERGEDQTLIGTLQDRLAWRGLRVRCDGHEGWLEGLDRFGRAMIRTAEGTAAVLSGSLERV